jgi:hypothetical protein
MTRAGLLLIHHGPCWLPAVGGCQSHIDTVSDQLCKPRPTTLPLFPDDGAPPTLINTNSLRL